ncbi:5-(carboxyamino)imidazole ribonucleotide synthase [Candidatus Liberibacter africanus]|uniref:N5-carboxyaminoimidazole ribonucleotide synthase n=1 Tax=Candidatus Liberibacter africanus PTSAPSY TaxID=1277257 RepID=A0A0G3I9J7_LIBAF|nr:5-(carboxyamino)imidazole ribonucleotide synthase [Candidatus Liberibacter africanus]AKK20442.1 phosphoribosylaminoimidazole carboxylase ATPase subunit [Candidatus Liberibacter africanus PTSAPSY]QTP64163.1 5-(carboxyamino)imidazole ribonucleotide synthase [Candidatus Liberibacter africanus]
MNQRTIGIIGGGQLARMLSMAAARLGFSIVILDPNADCPANQVSTRQIVAQHDDIQALNTFANLCDYATYESENIPAKSISYLSTLLPIYPSSKAIEISQDRLYEKQFFQESGIPTVDFYEISSQESLTKTLNAFQGKGILKTRRMGYDGKGQQIYNENDSTKNLYASLGNVPLIFERFATFSCEISIIAARALNGSICFYDPIQNTHIDGILHQSRVPSPISKKTSFLAYSAMKKVLTKLNYVGILCIEFFVTEDGKVIANEMAPRVHNSGHWTEACCTTSQFEQHIRSITNLPLGNPDRHSNCVMHNLIGSDIEQYEKWLNCNSSLVHIYGKSKTLPGRKMGHVTQIYPKHTVSNFLLS